MNKMVRQNLSASVYIRLVAYYLLFSFIFIFDVRAQYFSARKTYEAGINAFNDKNFFSARLLFQEILQKESREAYSDKAQYYLALTYYYQKDYRSAIFELNTLSRDYPSSKLVPRAQYWIGESYFLLNDFNRSRESHYQFVRNFGENPRAAYALYTIGYTYMQEKRYDEAIAEFRRALKRYNESKIAHEIALQLGISYVYTKEYKQARKSFRNLILSYKNSKFTQEAQFWIGKTHFAEKNYPEAIRQFQFVLEKFPKDELAAETLYHIALIHFRQKKKDRSAAILKNILKTKKKWSRLDKAHYRIAQIYYKTQAFKNALKHLTLILIKYKASEHYFSALEMYYDISLKQGNMKNMVSFIDKLLKENLQDTHRRKLLRKKADILYRKKDYEGASKIYKNIYDNFTPNEIDEILYMLARTNYRKNLYDEALEYLDKIIQNPKQKKWKPRAYLLKAEIYFSLDDYTSALQSYSRITRFFPKSYHVFDAAMGIGWTYFELKQYARANTQFKSLLQKYKKGVRNIKIRMAIASCQYNLRDFNKALKTYTYIMKQKKKFPQEAEESQFKNAWTYYRQKKYIKSAYFFQIYLKDHPNGKFVIGARYFLAWSQFYQKDYASASRNFVYISQYTDPSNPFHTKSILYHAKTEFNAGDYNSSYDILSKFIQDFPNSDQVEESYYILINCSLKLKNPENTYDYYKKLSRLAPGSAYLPESLRLLASYYKNHRYFEKAHEILEEISNMTQKEDERWSTRMSRVEIFLLEKKNWEAIYLLKSILDNKNDELIPYRKQTLNKLFEIYFGSENYNLLFRDIQNYNDVFKTDEDARIQTKIWEGKVLIKRNELDRAKKIFQELIDNKKYSLHARFYLGMIYYKQNDRPKAFDFLKQVAERSNDSLAPKARFRLGEILFEQGKYQKAILEYSKIIYLHSDLDELYEKSIYKTTLGFKFLKNEKQYNEFLRKLEEEFPKSIYLKKL